MKIFKEIDTEDFEIRMQELFNQLNSRGLRQGRGQVSSRHLRLRGYQCQYDPDDLQKLELLFDTIQEYTGWIPPLFYAAGFDLWKTGVRKSGTISNVINSQHGSLDDFIENESVFSYVIPNGGRINFTTGIKI